MEYTQIIVETIGHVGFIKLNYPPVNAYSRTLSDELTACLDLFSETDAIRSVVLTGEGCLLYTSQSPRD